MPVSLAMIRLLRIRNLQEQQRLVELDSALSELRRLEQALVSAAGRERDGRRLVERSASSGDLVDRLSGLEEGARARRHAVSLAPRIAETAGDVVDLREQYLASRVERRQAETLIDEERVREAIAISHRAQQALDDRYGARRQRQEQASKVAGPPTDHSTVIQKP